MSMYIKIGKRYEYGKINDMNHGLFKTARGSYGYGRPPIPKGSGELPDWLEASLEKVEWWGTDSSEF